MARTTSLCSAPLFSSSKMLQGQNLVGSFIYIYIYIFFYCHHVLSPCHHPSSILTHMLRQHPAVLLLVPRPWTASLKHAHACSSTKASSAQACAAPCKFIQDHIFPTTSHYCILHMEDICIQTSL